MNSGPRMTTEKFRKLKQVYTEVENYSPQVNMCMRTRDDLWNARYDRANEAEWSEKKESTEIKLWRNKRKCE